MTRAGRRDDEGDEPSSAGSRSAVAAGRSRPERPARPRAEREDRSARDGHGRPRPRDAGEPLRASWDPVDPRAPRDEPERGGRGARTWRLYAVPLLVVLTVLAVFQAVAPSESGSDSATSTGVTPAPSQPPVVGEAPAGSGADVDIPTAELPAGGAFPVSGADTWRVVPGATPQVGTGRVFTYTVEVEDGAVLPEGDIAFATAVDATLTDPRSWIGSGLIAVRRIDAGVPDFRVSLTSQLTTRTECGDDIRYDASCWRADLGRVLINGARWVRGAAAFDGQQGLYRQYAINHEVGHVFDNQHVPCTENGGLAPVMMQQTFGVSNDYLAQLTERNPQGIVVPRDGKTCQPNPWPYPQGGVSAAG